MTDQVKQALSGVAVKTVLIGLGGGAGAAVILAVARAISAEPRMVIQALESWGPLAMLACLGMFLVDRRVGDGIQVLRENATAQKDLADAVRQIADKDDRQAEEQRRLLNYVGSQMEKVLVKLEAIDSSTKSRGAHA